MKLVSNHVWQIEDNDRNRLRQRVEQSSFYQCLMAKDLAFFGSFESPAEAVASLDELSHPCNLLVLMDRTFGHDTQSSIEALHSIHRVWMDLAAKGSPKGDLQFVYYTNDPKTANQELINLRTAIPCGMPAERGGFPTLFDISPKWSWLINSTKTVIRGGSLDVEMIDNWALMQHAVSLPTMMGVQNLILGRGLAEEALKLAGNDTRSYLIDRFPSGSAQDRAPHIVTLLSRYDAFFIPSRVIIDPNDVMWKFEQRMSDPICLPLQSWLDDCKLAGIITDSQISLL